MSDPEYKERKMIVVDSCDTCPFNLKCKPWKSMSKKNKFALTLGVGVKKFILNGCPLPDGEDNRKHSSPTIMSKGNRNQADKEDCNHYKA